MGFGLGFVLFWRLGFVLPWGLPFVLGARFGTRVGVGEGGDHKLLAVSGGQGQVVNAARTFSLRLQDATTAGQMFGQIRRHLRCCDWMQMQLLQQGGDVDRPGVTSRPPHDEAHRLRVAGTDMHILDLQGGRQKNVFR